MTNYEKIKNMSVEEMAEWLENILEGECRLCGCDEAENCEMCLLTFCLAHRKLWLESEVEE